MKVLYQPHLPSDPDSKWSSVITRTCARHHDLTVFDPDKAGPPQFEGIQAIVDMGGHATRSFIDMAASAGVGFIQALTTGLDHVEVDYILKKGITLSHCPGALSAIPLAEHAMMFMLILAHRYIESAENFKKQILYRPTGIELEGRVLGIVGLGATGTELARRAKSFGMRIFAVDIRLISDDILKEIQPEFLGKPAELDEMIRQSDFLSLHLHLTAETKHIIDAKRISLIKPTACLINVSRGELVDENALHDALLAGKIGGAGLDAFAQEPPESTHPVYKLPNVVTTPHTSGATDGTLRRRVEFAADNLDRVARGEEPLGLITTDWKG